MATGGLGTTDADEAFRSVVYEQHCELIAAQNQESDLELAYNLQLQEALSVSLASQPSTSSSSIPLQEHELKPPGTQSDGRDKFPTLRGEELAKLVQELSDRKQSAIEARRIKEDLVSRIHDERFASDILWISEHDWREWGDNFERPYGAGCSSSNGVRVNGEYFRLYVKSLVSTEWVNDVITVLGGIGVAICDSRDNLIFNVRKPLFGNGMSKNSAEAKALIEGLNAAHALGLTRLLFFCDYHPLAQFVDGRWTPNQPKIGRLIDHVKMLTKNFEYFKLVFVARKDIKFAFKLARDAIESQITRAADCSHAKALKETCVICLEDTDSDQVFVVDDCLHRYCYSCMKQHVEVKLFHGMLPKCPHEGCNSNISVDRCLKFLTPKYIETMRELIKEASIPVAEKVYCPYPRCSALMSKTEVLEYTKEALFASTSTVSEARKCLNCHGLFCINCKVPWHCSMMCHEYKMLNPNPPAEEVKLKTLATRNFWRQCKKCGHMIELAEGCYHMTCRCGSQFCYNCGAEYMNKRSTCSCPLWNEANIWHEDHEEEDDYLVDPRFDFFRRN